MLVFFLLAGTVSCAHSVRMISIPEGAVIKVDGNNLGRAPLLYHERSGLPGKSHELRAELSGHQPIVRRESRRVCPTAANLIMDSFLVGFAYGFCLRDEYVFDFTQTSQQSTSSSGTR